MILITSLPERKENRKLAFLAGGVTVKRDAERWHAVALRGLRSLVDALFGEKPVGELPSVGELQTILPDANIASLLTSSSGGRGVGGLDADGDDDDDDGGKENADGAAAIPTCAAATRQTVAATRPTLAPTRPPMMTRPTAAEATMRMFKV